MSAPDQPPAEPVEPVDAEEAKIKVRPTATTTTTALAARGLGPGRPPHVCTTMPFKQEEYRVWKKHSPILCKYPSPPPTPTRLDTLLSTHRPTPPTDDIVITQALEWPSLTVQVPACRT